MQVSAINKSANFGYKFSKNFQIALENENFCYNTSNLSETKKREQIRYNNLIEKIEEGGSSDLLDINEEGMIVLGDKELGSTYFDYDIGKCISYQTLKNIYKLLFKKGKNHAN